MSNILEQLKTLTTVVADTGDIEAIKRFSPQDATTNPSLILKAVSLDHNQALVEQILRQVVRDNSDDQTALKDAADRLIVMIGQQILEKIPGRLSTEVDARLSFDTQASIRKARKLIQMYESLGIDRSRILIKLASTWEGIRAGEQLEKEGINCNLTLLFSFAQARACAEAGVFLISPFVGRVLDWHKKQEPSKTFEPFEEPGVQCVRSIYQYYKTHGYNTVVMGASFRNVGEIIGLAGCDRLTISPALLDELSQMQGPLQQTLSSEEIETQVPPEKLREEEFRLQHNHDAMATEKLAEGIRAFIKDQEALEKQLMEGIISLRDK